MNLTATKATFQKYPAYKDSGVDWLGEIPEHWAVHPGLRFISENKSKNTGMIRNTVLSLSYGKIRVKQEDELTGLVPESFETYQLVNKGDLIFRPTDLQNDKVSLRTAFSEYDGIITSAYLNLRFKKIAHSKYFHYLFRALDNNKVIYGLGSGLRQNISYLDFRRFLFPFPSYHEQTAIAVFLDDKTAKIDGAIAQKEKMIALLKERKQIIIQNAVTKGLNPNAKMKDSGVEWIGEIPEEWEMLPFTKYHIEKADYRGATPEKVEEGIFLLTAKNICLGYLDYTSSIEYVTQKGYNKIMQRGLPQKGDLLFTTEAPLGHFALVDREDVCFAQRVIRFRLNSNFLLPRFTLYSVISNYFQNQLLLRATGSTALGIKASKLAQLRVIHPPIQEQEAIITYIDTQSAKIDKAIKLQEQQIEKLKELKSTLIDSAVTGKIKV